MNPEEIVRRCTRQGTTSWFNVAQQLGCSVDQARSRHDPNYRRPNPFAERQAQKVPVDDDFDSVRSPHNKGPGLWVKILVCLDRRSSVAEEIAPRTGASFESVCVRLNEMLAKSLVRHDGRHPRTWSITDSGKIHLVARLQRKAA